MVNYSILVDRGRFVVVLLLTNNAIGGLGMTLLGQEGGVVNTTFGVFALHYWFAGLMGDH